MAGMIVRRGHIYYLDFEQDAGESIKKTRPALIIQNNAGNRHSLYSIVTPLIHDSGKSLPIRIPIPKGVGGLTKDSVVDCGHIETIKQDRLQRFCGILPNHYLSRVDRALAVSLGLRLRNV